MKELTIRSPAFGPNKKIPVKYTCQGEDINPPLTIEGIPEGTKSLVLIVDDPDAPMGTWVHWVVWNIDPVNTIEEDSVPGEQGINDFDKHEYGGPCPPSGEHRYFFTVYALDTMLDLETDTKKLEVEQVMEENILAKGELIGLYSKE